MSIKSLLMPAVTAYMLSEDRLQAQREQAERQRIMRGEPHRLLYFHQVDDPYSALAAQSLEALLSRYDLQLQAHVVGAPADDAAPERAHLVAYSRRDAALLARQWGLDFIDHGAQPTWQAVEQAQRQLVTACKGGGFAAMAVQVTRSLWSAPGAACPDRPPMASPATTAEHIRTSEALRKRLGHYLGACFFYGGEWYWGIDRLHHLETRLHQLGAQRPGVHGLLFSPPPDLQMPTPAGDAPVIDFFFSLRSPYSAIVTPRVYNLARHSGAQVCLRPVLPMVMRGLAVPRNKRMYIVRDAAREARLRDIPFGRLNDPVGRPTERGMAVLAWAQQAGRGAEFLQSFMQGVWAEGLNAGSTRGLRRITERAGLSWIDARDALADESWRQDANANRAALFALGLWGVPSFQVRNLATWGQDRLWAVQQAVLE